MDPPPNPPALPPPVCPTCGEPLGDQPFCTPCLFRRAVEARSGPSATLAEDLAFQRDADAGSRDGLPPTEFGDYRLRERIGEGGMGIVYRAYKLSLKKDVAIKFIKAGRHASDRQIALFLREAELASKLDHPNIVTVSEVGERDGHRYLVMRFIDGEPMSERLRSVDFCPTVHERVRFLATIAHAVHHAHQRGVIHRDLKPGNILMDREGTPFVGDFGLARWAERDSTVTFGDRVVGTPAYMPPEQARGQRDALTIGSDVWSLGVMLYEMISGRLPFEADAVPAIVLRILQDDPPSPFRIGPPSDPDDGFSTSPRPAHDVAAVSGAARRDLESICLHCLEKNSARRYPTAGALAEDLDRWLDGRPVVARPVHGFEKAIRWTRRRPALAGLAVASLVAVFALGISVWLNAAKRRTEQHRREFNYVADMNLVQAALRETNFVVFERAMSAANQSDLRGLEWGLMRTIGNATVQPVWFDAHQPILSLAVSPPEAPGVRRLAVVGTNTVLLLDAVPRVLRRWARTNDATMAGVAFSPDASIVAVGDSSGLELFDTRDAARDVAPFHLADGIHRAVSISPDGRWLASAARFPSAADPYPDELVQLHDLARRQLSRTLTNEGRAFHWINQGRGLWIANERGAVLEWETETGNTTQLLQGGFVGDTFQFSPSGRLLARSSNYGVVHLRDTTSAAGEAVQTFTGLPLRGQQLAFSADETRFAMVTTETAIRVTDPRAGASAGLDRVLIPGHIEAISAVLFAPGSEEVLTASRDGTIRRLPLTPSDRQAVLNVPHYLATEAGVSPVFSPDSRRVALLERRALQFGPPFDPESTVLYDLASATIVGRLPAEVIGWNDSNRILTWDRDGLLRLWDVSQPSQPRELGRRRLNEDHHVQIDSQVAAHGRWVVSLTRSRGQPQAFDARTGQTQILPGIHADTLATSATTPFAAVGVVGDHDRAGGVALWNLEKNRVVTQIPDVTPADFRFSPSGRILVATGWNRQLHLYDGATGEELQRLRGHLGTVMAVAFTPDERQLITGGNDYSLVVWNMATGREVLRLQLTAPVAWIRVSPDQQWLATGHTPTEVGIARSSLSPGHYRLWPISGIPGVNPGPPGPAPGETIWTRFPSLPR